MNPHGHVYDAMYGADVIYKKLLETRNRQKGSLKFLSSFNIQHTKYSLSVKFAVPRQ